MLRLKTKNNKHKIVSNQDGNVLFLILIAVVLFAALSYAVTQSTRSGGGGASQETSLISSANVTQYPASIRTAILRMIVSNNTDADVLAFDPPTDFATFCDVSAANASVCVFHPDGGAALYNVAPDDVVSVPDTAWTFNAENEVNFIGRSAGGNSPTQQTADIIAFLPNIRRGICERINEELGIGAGTIPTESNIDVASEMEGATGIPAAPGGGTIGDDITEYDSEPFGCFEQGGVNYYYHVLVEQ